MSALVRARVYVRVYLYVFKYYVVSVEEEAFSSAESIVGSSKDSNVKYLGKGKALFR